MQSSGGTESASSICMLATACERAAPSRRTTASSPSTAASNSGSARWPGVEDRGPAESKLPDGGRGLDRRQIPDRRRACGRLSWPGLDRRHRVEPGVGRLHVLRRRHPERKGGRHRPGQGAGELQPAFVVPGIDATSYSLDGQAIQMLTAAGFTVVPEPSTLVLLAAGLLAYAWRKRK
jgi:hypothetical protein